MIPLEIRRGKNEATDVISLRMKFNVMTVAEIAFPHSIPTMGTSKHNGSDVQCAQEIRS